MLFLIHRDRRKDKDGKVRKDDDWEEKRPREKKGRTPLKGYSGSKHSHSISRSEERELKWSYDAILNIIIWCNRMLTCFNVKKT